MNLSKIINSLRNQLTDGLQIEQEDNDRIAVYTPFMYQDGDHVSFAVARDAATSLWHLTDDGDVLTHASYSGINLLASDRVSRFRETVQFYGLRERRGELWMPIENDAFGDAFFTFTQACLDIVQLTKMPPERKERTPVNLRSFLRMLITQTIPHAEVVEKWYDETLDQERVYPVDLRIRGKNKPLFVYEITSDRHCLTSTVSCLHHKLLKQSDFIGVAIFDDEESIPRLARIPLVEAVDKHYSSQSQTEEIKELLLTEAA
ncbi:MAG: DUF1828 domain-containing protein [Pirellulales bacterium]|nr:DUF1828 domain-containing protein [Pirellulales bacterium]